jgi:ABC-2 type transport system permease protein/oleandomycin transport system permease protein
MSVQTGLFADAAPPRARRSTVAAALHDGWVVAKRNLKHFTRKPRLLVFSTIQPVMFVLLFAFVFDGAVRGALPEGFGSYLAYVMPGIFVQSTTFRMTQTAVGLAEDLEKGVIDRIRSMPVARSAVLVGRTFADLVRGTAVILLMVAVGLLVGFDFERGVVRGIASIVVVGLFGYAFSWVFVYVALTVPGAESTQAAAFVLAFPLTFISSVFVPTRTYSVEWLAVIARNSPVTAAADAARGLAVSGPVTEPLVHTIAWSLALLAIFIPLSVARFRRIE